MYNNPWEAPQRFQQPPFVASAFTGIPIAYEGPTRKAPAAQVFDEPWPSPEDNKEAFVRVLCTQVLRAVYKVLETNKSIDEAPCVVLPRTEDKIANATQEAESFMNDDSLLLPAPPPRKPNEPPPQATADVNASAFASTAVFPAVEDPKDVSLIAKLALVTPAHPDCLLFDAENHEELKRLLGDDVDIDRATRAARITTQWLRESFGDDSIPKPTAEVVVGRRNSQTKDDKVEDGAAATAASTHQCNACKVSMRLQSFRVRCAECEDFDLCERCFCEGREVQSHKKEHYFIPVGPNQFPLFHSHWTADEELFLLDAVGKFGFGNWPDVAEQVSLGTSTSVPQKDKESCERRYFDFHLSSKENTDDDFYPFSSLMNKPAYPLWKSFLTQVKQMDKKEKEAKEKARPKVSMLAPPKIVVEEDSEAPIEASKIKVKESLIMDVPQLPPKVHILGFLPCRGDFEIEWENQAELAIADLEIRENESPMEKEVKLKMMEYYNSILDDRIRRKKVMIEKKLYDTKLSQQMDKMRTFEEKSIHELLKPLWKHFYLPYMESKPPLFTSDRKIRTVPAPITESDLDELTRLLIEDDALVDRLNKLTLWRQHGLKTLADVLNFDSGGEVSANIPTEETSRLHSTQSDGDVPKLSSGKYNLTPLEAHICEELQVKEEFLVYIKKMVQQEVESSCANGSINIDPDTGLKILQMEDGDIMPLNDFIVDAHIELNSDIVQQASEIKNNLTDAEAGDKDGSDSRVGGSGSGGDNNGLVIPRKRKQPKLQQQQTRMSSPSQDNAASPYQYQSTESHSMLPSLESLANESSRHSDNTTHATHMSAPSPSQMATMHPNIVNPQIMREEAHREEIHRDVAMYMSPMAAPMCPASPSSDSGLLETEEGEIEEDDVTSERDSSSLLKPPPPPPSYGHRIGHSADRGLGKGGKAEKRARRGSGGLGLAVTSASVNQADDSGQDESGAEEEESQKKAVSLSSDVQAQSDDDLLS